MRVVSSIVIACTVGGCFSDPESDGSGDTSGGPTSTTATTTTSEPVTSASTTSVDGTTGTGTPADSTSVDDTTAGPPTGPTLQQVTLDTTASLENLVDIPVLLRLSPDVFDYAAALPDGADLRIFADDQRTQLAYELEAWTPGGATFVWVRLPDVQPATPTTIVLAYGDPTLPLPPPSTQVWSAGYEAVWHLPTLTDSTGNGHDLAAVSRPNVVPGLIGDAVVFPPGADALSAANADATLSFGTIGTIEAWVSTQVNSQLPGGTHRVVVENWPNYRLVSISGAAGGRPQLLALAAGTTESVGVVSALVVDQWTRLEGSIDTTVGGMDWCLRTSLGLGNCSSMETATTDPSTSAVEIGGIELNAEVDEVRFSTVRHSISWGAVQDASVLDPDFAVFAAPGA